MKLFQYLGGVSAMTNRSSFNSTKFDEYNVTYDIALAKGLSISGEDQDYFARHRIAWVADRLQQLHQQPKAVMDSVAAQDRPCLFCSI